MFYLFFFVFFLGGGRGTVNGYSTKVMKQFFNSSILLFYLLKNIRKVKDVDISSERFLT